MQTLVKMRLNERAQLSKLQIILRNRPLRSEFSQKLKEEKYLKKKMNQMPVLRNKNQIMKIRGQKELLNVEILKRLIKHRNKLCSPKTVVGLKRLNSFT